MTVRPDTPSWTAELTAALRADHSLHDDPVVFDDRVALELLDRAGRQSVESGDLRRRVEEGALRPTQGHLVARARIAADVLVDALARGAEQVAVIGAGLDTTCLRDTGGARLVEIDHPATQAVKRERLRAARGTVPAGLELAAVDLAREPLDRALTKTSWRTDVPGVCLWLGVSMYLAPPATRDALAAMVRSAAPGSELVFDYAVPRADLPPRFREIAERKEAEVSARGEPRIGSFDPPRLLGLLRELGLEPVRHLTHGEVDAQLYAGRGDGLRANPENIIVHARVC